MFQGENRHYLDYSLSFDMLPHTAQQMLIGSLLGDGSIPKVFGVHANCWFAEGHGKKQLEYVKWKAQFLKMFLPKFYRNSILTLRHPIFTELRKEFYVPGLYRGETKKGKNYIPPKYASLLDAFGLLIWYLDDGNLAGNRVRIGCKNLSINLESSLNIINKNIGLNMYAKRTSLEYNKNIVIPSQDRDKLFQIWGRIAKQYRLPDEMMYKLTVERNSKWTPSELAMLVNNKNKSVQCLSGIIGRDECSVVTQRRNLGIKNFECRKWTSAEESIIKANMHLTHAEVATLISRSKHSVDMRCFELGITKINRWKVTEDNLIKLHKGSYNILKHLLKDRDERSLKRRIIQLGFYQKTPWKKHELELIKKEDLSAKDLLRLLPHRSYKAINHKIKRCKLLRSKHECI